HADLDAHGAAGLELLQGQTDGLVHVHLPLHPSLDAPDDAFGQIDADRALAPFDFQLAPLDLLGRRLGRLASGPDLTVDILENLACERVLEDILQNLFLAIKESLVLGVLAAHALTGALLRRGRARRRTLIKALR